MFWQLLITIIGTSTVSAILGIWFSNIEDKHMLREKKKIHIYYVNKIKNLDYKIFEQKIRKSKIADIYKSLHSKWKKLMCNIFFKLP